MMPSIPRASVLSLGRLALAIVFITGAGGACSSSSKVSSYPDASPGTGTGGHVGVDGGTGGGTTTGTGGTTVAGTGGVGGGGVLPAALNIFPGPSALLGPGASCSTPATPVGGGTKPDRWCGVIAPGPVANTIGLLAINLTRAIAGAVITCAAGDPNCVALSTNLDVNGNHGFFSDNLLYYETGTAFAWRPGWTAGRAILTLDQPANCTAGGTPTVICVKQTADTMVNNLYAGRIDTQTGSTIPLVEAVSATIGNISFSMDWQSVLWSTATSATSPEILKMQTIGDATTVRTVASNVTLWTLTPDGMRWLWLSQPTVDANMFTTGTLQSSPYPSGAAPQTIQTVVFDYAPWAAKSAFVISNPTATAANLTAVSDIDNPTTSSHVLATQTAFDLLDLTPAGNVLYFNNLATDPTNANSILTNVRAVKSDGTGVCAVSVPPVASQGVRFSTSTLGVLWSRIGTDTTGAVTTAGVYTKLAGCTSVTFSSSPFALADAAAGLVIIDTLDPTTGAGPLRFSPFSTDGTLGTAVSIDPGADSTFQSLFPDTPRVVYAVIQNGIFVSAPLAGTTAPFLPSAASPGATTTASPAMANGGGSLAGATARWMGPRAAAAAKNAAISGAAVARVGGQFARPASASRLVLLRSIGHPGGVAPMVRGTGVRAAAILRAATLIAGSSPAR